MSLIDLLNADQLNVAHDAVFSAEVGHFLRRCDAADTRSGKLLPRQ
jgi:hypothetical protein